MIYKNNVLNLQEKGQNETQSLYIQKIVIHRKHSMLQVFSHHYEPIHNLIL